MGSVGGRISRSFGGDSVFGLPGSAVACDGVLLEKVPQPLTNGAAARSTEMQIHATRRDPEVRCDIADAPQ